MRTIETILCVVLLFVLIYLLYMSLSWDVTVVTGPSTFTSSVAFRFTFVTGSMHAKTFNMFLRNLFWLKLFNSSLKVRFFGHNIS